MSTSTPSTSSPPSSSSSRAVAASAFAICDGVARGSIESDSYKHLAPAKRTLSGSSDSTIRPPTSKPPPPPSPSKSLAYSSDRALNTIKHIAQGVKRKGRHLKLKSDSAPTSQPLLLSSSSPPQNQPQYAANQQNLLIDSFAQQLSVSSPPALSSSTSLPITISTTSLDAPSLLDAPVRRRPSFRHENYPRRHPIMQQSPQSSQSLSQEPPSGAPASAPPSQTITGPEPDPDDMFDIKVPALLQQGTPMLKVSAKKIKSRVFRLDADLGQIQWESKKSGVSE